MILKLKYFFDHQKRFMHEKFLLIVWPYIFSLSCWNWIVLLFSLQRISFLLPLLLVQLTFGEERVEKEVEELEEYRIQADATVPHNSEALLQNSPYERSSSNAELSSHAEFYQPYPGPLPESMPMIYNPYGPPPKPNKQCLFWCPHPTKGIYCCKFKRPKGLKRGTCPEVRSHCPSGLTDAKTSKASKFIVAPEGDGFPILCNVDTDCGGIDKCCYDRCFDGHVCKPALFFQGFPFRR